MKKAELEDKIIAMEKENRALKVEIIYLNDECKHLAKSLGLVGKTCHEIYKCYPYVFKECCTEPQLLTFFKVQAALNNFLKKLMNFKHDDINADLDNEDNDVR